MKLLYGKPIADEILSRLQSDIFKSAKKPGLAVILVGNNEASKIYVALKEKAAAEIGMNFFLHRVAENVSEKEVTDLIEKLNRNDSVHGIIVQLPLPAGFDTEKIISSIDPEKDADGFHVQNIADFMGGNGKIFPVFPQAILYLIESSGEEFKNKKAIVIANSDEFGKVMVSALEQKSISAEYIISSEIQRNLGKIGVADIVVSAVGSPGLIKSEMLKEGAIIIDGGITKIDSKIVGDVDFSSTEAKSGYISPVPGGVGPLTIACLLENTYLAFRRSIS
ncbi:MAG TPA: bifunctional 5,10-methylenetetrahydrofolate dehydrogenase/5,10-methenyltetrahydrofolate cyclohydrolase [Candidatus Moranbacteria bacterium]|nr:bifunctional 5,10-methylenetetrahydrofolate dehydrogenase/5,10-methenyltetrahydrofolate cyclohydrolase [Candidatus Moranbacteria bacterium]HRY28052.1 bifunctional 5,10-methylenetetrahydrofolate dehydrogenase/5,10-methenyltetrahydrofolate cyclohydrolase [Candidatus Moranbacteria bacterium]HSA07873.1 bifunctional 5,10-methylenetetrahydrofolate dehydrogenase/5,10-methenyltetrahydrofolate cyclohydrolase [Candidatus Moranbacteria bacterium]